MSKKARTKKILSIQSSVVFGYVGNRAATFPLQLLGHDVSCLNTVQFSTHTGYPGPPRGLRLTRQQIQELYAGLVASTRHDDSQWDGILTGYVPGVEGVQAISETIIPDLQQQHHQDKEQTVVWVLDPVMGDEERGLYVSPEIPPLYRQLVPYANVITPNQFELAQLSQLEIQSMAQLKAGIEKVHEMGVKNIVVTTFRDPEDTKVIKIIGSTVNGTSGGNGNSVSQFGVDVPYYSRPYQGTGDLFAALLLAALLSGLTLSECVVKALNQMRPVLETTGQVFDQAMAGRDWRTEKMEGRGARVAKSCELNIVECAQEILDPVPFHKAYPI